LNFSWKVENSLLIINWRIGYLVRRDESEIKKDSAEWRLSWVKDSKKFEKI
jgi:hypothetical protein